jgi:hypothetical protein
VANIGAQPGQEKEGRHTPGAAGSRRKKIDVDGWGVCENEWLIRSRTRANKSAIMQ